MRRRTALRLLVCWPLLAALGCDTAPLRLEPPRPSVILVTLDTTRPDHLGCYGHERPTSPSLDRLASESLVYTRAYATSSWTLPSHASLFTGRLPTSHGARHDPEGPLALTDAISGPASWSSYRVRGLAEGETTLARLLADAGHATGAVVAGPWMKRVFGLGQGFERYDDSGISSVRGRPASDVTDAAIRLVEEWRDTPFFLFLNYYDPHTPYSPPDEYARPFLEALPSSADDAARIRALYDAEIRYMDEHLGRLFEALRRLELFDASLIVVTSDHGDLLGEHGQRGHGYYLTQQEIRIPFIVKYPGDEVAAGRRAEPVQLTDVLPLILDRLALPVPESIQGGSPPDVGHPIVAEVYPRAASRRYAGDWRSLIDGPFKLLWNSRSPHQLYDIERDPGESTDLAPAQAERAVEMETALLRYLDALPGPLATRGPADVIDAETREALEGLGYLD